MRYLIEHKVTITFPKPVREHHCELRIAPPDTATQRTQSLRVAIEPAAPVATYTDYFGNRVHYFSLIAPHDAVEVLAQAEVETLLANPFDYPLMGPAEEREWMARALHDTPRLWDDVLHRSDLVPDVAALGAANPEWPTYSGSVSLREAVTAASAWAAEVLPFDPTLPPHPSLAAALATGSAASCDLAHLLVAVVRSWGCPARYVWGHADPELEAEDGHPAREPLQAWAEALIPGAGWRGFDPVRQLVTNDAYVVVATGRDASEADPCRSSIRGVAEQQEVQAVSVRIKRAQQQQ
jgi:transglutaminase-like putative cysteine protease